MYRGSGLRRMRIGSDEAEGAKKRERQATTPAKASASTAAVAATVTPASGSRRGAASSPAGAHVSIVTPDGKPLHLPTTPVVSRKLDINSSDMMVISSPSVESPSAESQQQLPHTTQSSSSSSLPTMGALKVNSSEGLVAMQEGDQANALLSRRLDQYQARHHSSSEKR